MKNYNWFPSQIHVHGNNLATLHAQVPPRLLPAELGGEGAEYHPHTWASTMFKRTPSQQEQQESSQQEQQQEQLPRDQPPEEQHQGQADPRVASQESNSHNGFNGPTKKAQESPRSFSNHSLSLSTSCDLSSENTSAAPPSPDTPLVNKPETNSTIAASFTAMIFGKSESVSKSNGNMSDGEEVALKAHWRPTRNGVIAGGSGAQTFIIWKCELRISIKAEGVGCCVSVFRCPVRLLCFF